jgi:hypothetical protein
LYPVGAVQLTDNELYFYCKNKNTTLTKIRNFLDFEDFAGGWKYLKGHSPIFRKIVKFPITTLKDEEFFEELQNNLDYEE